MNEDKIADLHIEPSVKRRSSRSVLIITVVVLAVSAIAFFYAWPRVSDKVRVFGQKTNEASTSKDVAAQPSGAVAGAGGSLATDVPAAGPVEQSDAVLTVSGYIINRERIEVSPRFMGVVKWIGVKKGDSVTNGQVLVLLDDAEYRARLAEMGGRLAATKVAIEKATLDYNRARALVASKIERQQAEDDARLELETRKAQLIEVEGSMQLIQTYLGWCVIRSPVDGVVLEKLVDPSELVTPQSFGGTRGPSTALVSLADPKDLQVEIDLNEVDLAKVSLEQKCRVVPEAYPDRTYQGRVVEIAPEASRQKGTLQIKVQIKDPDSFLTPELTAKVDFLKASSE
jgi:HlyD family secretion protein